MVIVNCYQTWFGIPFLKDKSTLQTQPSLEIWLYMDFIILCSDEVDLVLR